LLLNALTGAETGAGLGLLDACTVFYPEAMLLDADIYQRVRHEAGGLDTGPAALALDVIRQVGPRGHFLAHAHTRTHLRQRAFSPLAAQPASAGGYQDPLQVARQKVDWILEHHHPQPLETAQHIELERILAAADQDLG
jgi:trimethylamine---corrinoid protein Co-methyltransferase